MAGQAYHREPIFLLAVLCMFFPGASPAAEPFDPVVFIENAAGYQGISQGGGLGGRYTGSGFVIDVRQPLRDDERDPETCPAAAVAGIHLLSNEHVVRSTNELQVTFLKKLPDGNIGQETFLAEVVGADEELDASLLFIPEASLAGRGFTGEDFASYPLGTSDPTILEQGMAVAALGNPGGLKRSLSQGVISSEKQIFGNVIFPVIQTDAALNPGNSGGPLLLQETQSVIGVNTLVRRGSQNIGFAIPIDRVKRFVVQLLCDGRVAHGSLPFDVQEVDEKIRAVLGLPAQRGEIVSRAYEVLGAAGHDLRVRDVILSVRNDEAPLLNEAEGRARPVGRGGDPLRAILFSREPGEETVLNVLRDGELAPVAVRLAALENGVMDRSRYLTVLGAFFQDVPDGQRRRFSFGGQGVLVGYVINGSDADQAKLRRRDVVQHVRYRTADGSAGFDVAELEDLRAISEELERLVERSRAEGTRLIVGFRGYSLSDCKPFYRFLRVGDSRPSS